MEVRIATSEDEAAWNNYVFNHPEALAYHQFAWKKAVSEAYGFDGYYLLAEESGRILGVLPLIYFKVPLVGRSLVSLPYCDISGCLTDNEEVSSTLLKKAVEIGQQKKTGKIEIRQTSGEKESSAIGKVRMVLELPDSSEKLLAGFRSKLRSQVKKPSRDGLSAQLGGLELTPEFYRVFCENMRDLGSPVHSRKWIDAVVKHYGDKARVGLVYTQDGIPAAAGIVLLANDTVSIPWASSLSRFNHYNSNMLLYWSFLSFSADNGFRYFDFGRSTPGEGTYKFKQQWGAEPVPLDWQIFNSVGDRLKTEVSVSQLRGKVESFWQQLPLPLSNFAGPIIRRYVSL